MNRVGQLFSRLKPYQKLIIAFIFAIIIGGLAEKFAFPAEPFSIPRFIIITCIFFVLAIPPCVFGFHATFDFAFRKRYWIGAIIFAILVLGGFHGSSVNMLNYYVQPGIAVENTQPLLGELRVIRGDEWATSTLTQLSQVPNNLETENSILNGYTKNITFYPRVATKSLTSISNPRTFGYFFLPTEQAFAFSWYIGYFILFFATLELLMLLTKKNRLFSTLGAIMITFAPAIQWWEGWDIIAFGELAIVLFDLLLKSNKLIKQILLSLAIGLVGCCYIMCLYPAWQIPYGFIFLILAIWVIKNNLKNCSVRKFAILFISILLCIGVIIVPSFIQSYNIYQLMSNTVYPGARLSTGGSLAGKFFNYFGNLFMPFDMPANPSEASQFISLFPIPIIMGIYYWFTNRKAHKKDFLLVSLVILAILLSIWNFVPLPEWLVKITFLSMSTPDRTIVTVSFICVLLLIYCLSNYSSKESIKPRVRYLNLIVAALTTILGIYVAYNSSSYIQNGGSYISTIFVILDLLFFIPIIYLCLSNQPCGNKFALSLLALVVFISGIAVHPLSQGLNIIYGKPIAKEIQKIEAEDSDAIWFIVDPNWPINDYPATLGADTINSTNYFPNFELYRKLGLEDQDQIYNRYAHIIGDVSSEPSSVTKNQEDLITLTVNNEDVCKIDVDYLLVHNKDLDQYDTSKVDFNKIYDEDYYSIYQVDCQE